MIRKHINKIVTNKIHINGILLIICFLGFLIRVFQLDAIPGEIWGDVIEHHVLAQNIIHGDFFFNYIFGGDGALFSYILAFVNFFFGMSFFTMKFVTVFIGTAGVAATYFFAKTLFRNTYVGYIASFLTAASFWTIAYSRMAKPHILVPLFVSLVFTMALKKKNIFNGIFVGLGMYTQAGFWGVFPFAIRNIKTFLITLLVMSPLIIATIQNISYYTGGGSFYGEKLKLGTNEKILYTMSKLAENAKKNFLSFYVSGDITFRQNIPTQPHIDAITAVFFTLGFFILIIYILRKRDRNLFFYGLLPFFIIQIPSILDINNPLSLPNNGRMIGITPFIYSFTALGLYTFFVWIKKIFFYFNFKGKKSTVISSIILICILGSIFAINMYKYFVIYPITLPNHNTPFGKIIAQKLDTYPNNVPVIIIGSGWGDWGQPEVAGLPIVMKSIKNLSFVDSIPEADTMLCKQQKFQKTVLIVNPQFKEFTKGAFRCFLASKTDYIGANNFIAAIVMEGQSF